MEQHHKDSLRHAKDLLAAGRRDRRVYERTSRAEASRKPHKMRQDLTGAQRHKRAVDTANIDLEKRIQDSGLWANIPLSRRTWCARLRELELHPERFEQIKGRYTKAQLARRAAAEVFSEYAAAAGV